MKKAYGMSEKEFREYVDTLCQRIVELEDKVKELSTEITTLEERVYRSDWRTADEMQKL